MLETITVEDFESCLNHSFKITGGDGQSTVAKLTEVNPVGSEASSGNDSRRPFSLIFHAESSDCFAQRIFKVDHEKLGELEIFLVPLGTRQGGMLYEAVFS